ncbi:MAG TPA: hypothetical protein VFX95_09230 [Caulobacteraceae bacterium]|nr:hypothetical protein [Caulobacteraceae bacterium]
MTIKLARATALTAAVAMLGASLAGCATTTKVATQQPGDLSMSCEQIKTEFTKLDAVMQEADGNKGVNAANVAAVLFFWPAAVGNYMDADKAEKLVEQRRTHLTSIYNQKGCV